MLTDDYRTTREFWDHAVASAPDRLAAVCLERRLTYREADAECAALAAGLQRATGKVSPTIAVCLPNCLEYFLLYWALVKAGGIIVPVNPWLKADSLTDIFATVQPDALIVRDDGDRDPLAAAAARHWASQRPVSRSFAPANSSPWGACWVLPAINARRRKR